MGSLITIFAKILSWFKWHRTWF